MPYYKCDVRKEEFITTIVYAENEANARTQVDERIRQSVLLHGGTVTCACTGVTQRGGPEVSPPENEVVEELVDTLACRTCGRMPSARLTGEESWTVECGVCTEGPAGIAPGEGEAMDGWNEAVRMTHYPRVGKRWTSTAHCPRCGQWPRVEPTEGGWNVSCCCEDAVPAIGGIAPELDQAILNWNVAAGEEVGRTRDEAQAMPEPLPCPTCGNAASYWRKGKVWTVGCAFCPVDRIQDPVVASTHGQGMPTGVSEDRDTAINKWNEAVRPPEPLPCPACHNVPSCGTDDEKLWTVECMFCPPRHAMRGVADDKDEAISKWNEAVQQAETGGFTITSEALPCPTCSNLPSCGRKEEGAGPWRVGCMTCPSVLGRVGISDERIVAIDAWNDAVRSVDASDETCPVCDKEGSQ